MDFAKVSANLLDLWTEPRYQSERASQLLFLEPLRLLSERDGFFQVEQSDGYTGWADQRFLVKCAESAFNNYNKTANFIITSGQAKLLGEKWQSIPPHFLYYGTKLTGAKTKSGFIRFKQQSGETAYVKAQNIKPIIRKEAATGKKIVKEAQKWLGVPYLWGGITPAGFDCSGFVRQVYAQLNIYVPRDTKDQINAGREVDRKSIMIGDLVFFKRHVGIAINGSSLIHCSLGSNGVRIQSIEKKEKDYRPDLDINYVTTRRII
ncbi:MAG: C40 family peptidase [Candidatus Zixiibacteriota bacterium]